MYEGKENLMGALTGAATAALASYVRNEDDLERRLRNTRDDAEEALDLIREQNSRGEVIRSRLPTVNDLQVALSIASQQQTAPAVIPTTSTVTRPDLFTTMEVAVADLSWPPQPGRYTANGLVEQAGELTASFLAMTYEEVRAHVMGLVQAKPPSREAKLQLFYVANALSVVVSSLRLTPQQYRDAWTRLFTGQVAPPSQQPVPQQQPQPEAHRDAARPPQIVGALGANVASVVPLSSQFITGYPFANRNTDEAMRFRITAGASQVTASTTLCTIRFGTEYRYRGADNSLVPFQPVIAVNSTNVRLCADGVTSQLFTLTNTVAIQPNQTLDVFIAVLAGHATEG